MRDVVTVTTLDRNNDQQTASRKDSESKQSAFVQSSEVDELQRIKEDKERKKA